MQQQQQQQIMMQVQVPNQGQRMMLNPSQIPQNQQANWQGEHQQATGNQMMSAPQMSTQNANITPTQQHPPQGQQGPQVQQSANHQMILNSPQQQQQQQQQQMGNQQQMANPQVVRPPFAPQQGPNQLNQGQGPNPGQMVGINPQMANQQQQQQQVHLNVQQQQPQQPQLQMQQQIQLQPQQSQPQIPQSPQSHQPTSMMGNPSPQQQLVQQQLQQQEQQSNSVNPKTKTALANLLSNRLQTAPTPTNPPSQQQQQIAIPPPQSPMQSVMIQPQQQPQPQQQQQQQQQQLLLQQQQRRSLQNITNGSAGTLATGLPNSNPAVVAGSAPPAAAIQQQNQPVKHGMTGPFTGVRMPGPGAQVVGGPAIPGPPAIRRDFSTQQQQQLQHPPQQAQQQLAQPQQQQLYGHELGVKVAEHLCLLGCVILIVDYQRNVVASQIIEWTKLLSSKGAEVETMYSPRITHLICETSRSAVAQQALRDGKRLVTAFWLNDVITKQHMSPPWHVLHFPTPYSYTEKPCQNMMASLSGFEGTERDRIRFMCESVGLKCTGHFSSQHDVLICRKPEGLKFQKARESRKPIVTTTWLSQVYFGFLNAINQIHHPKYQQFNLPAYQQDPFKFELNMAGNFLAAWRVPIKITPEALDKFNKLPPQLRLKRQSSNVSNQDNDGEGPSKKKLKGDEDDREKMERSSSNVDAILEDVIKGGFEEKGGKNRIMVRFSGFDSSEASKAVLKLGGGVASTNREATHLVMPTLMRTPKLLCCVPFVKFVVSPLWIQDSLQQGQFVNEQTYLLRDTELERKMNIDMPKLLATPLRDQLFKGKTFYVTPSVVPSRSLVRDIIESSGGKVVAQPKSMRAISEINQKDQSAYMVISCSTDFHLLTDAIKNKIGIYSTEYVLSAVLKQSLGSASFRID
uniref:PAX-interacting protein 1 n=1 Tax=Alona affinis TaxID=381656 RepID=A0A9N6WNP3_9CRUS|nr:EOG090X027U [Alona affinis]